MKKVFCFIVMILACMLWGTISGCTGKGAYNSTSFSGQSISSNDQSTTERLFTSEDMFRAIEEHKDSYVGWMKLPCGDALTALKVDPPFDCPGEVIDFCVFQMMDDGHPKAKLICQGDETREINIFYRETDPEDYETFSPSEFEFWEGTSGTDVLIFVTGVYREGDDYTQSDYYGLVPSDTLNSTPLKLHRESWNEGFPMWVYGIPLDQIDDSYELCYGDYVLTGSDILNKTWAQGAKQVN